MAESKIEWCRYTWNSWFICTKMTYTDVETGLDIGHACDHCYAESWSKRSGLGEWGGERKHTSSSIWKSPFKWNAEAGRTGIRDRVFWGSLMDVADIEVSQHWREDAIALVNQCPNLDWMMLTKRLLPHPELGITPDRLLDMFAPWREQWPEHVWFGHTLANQQEADLTLAAIAQIPAPIRFISHEPFLGPIDYADYGDVLDLVILGGESGGKSRMCDLDAMAKTIASCRAAGIKVFIKQLGAKPIYHHQPLKLKSRKGGEMDEWPAEFRVREMPVAIASPEEHFSKP